MDLCIWVDGWENVQVAYVDIDQFTNICPNNDPHVAEYTSHKTRKTIEHVGKKRQALV